MSQARITAIINQKGGVAKTTTAHILSLGLTKRGCKVLTIDTDPQANLSFTMGADLQTSQNLYAAMKGIIAPEEAISKTEQGHLIPSSLELAGADMEFTQTGREYILKEVLDSIASRYDHIVIDCPPALNIMTINALTAATDIVIPISADIYSLQGLQQLLLTISRVRKYSNHRLNIAGLLITRKGIRSNATTELMEAIRAQATAQQLHLYESVIREAASIKMSQIMRASLFDIDPKGKATADYDMFINEYIEQEIEKE